MIDGGQSAKEVKSQPASDRKKDRPAMFERSISD